MIVTILILVLSAIFIVIIIIFNTIVVAAATPGVLGSPSPLVVQRALSDFYVEYQLLFLPADQRQRPALLSALHRNIQDEFNRNGVQIMSPNFVAQPEQPVMVPPEQWFAAPATRPDEPAGR